MQLMILNQNQTLSHTHQSLDQKTHQALWVFMQSMLLALIHCRLHPFVGFIKSFSNSWC